MINIKMKNHPVTFVISETKAELIAQKVDEEAVSLRARRADIYKKHPPGAENYDPSESSQYRKSKW